MPFASVELLRCRQAPFIALSSRGALHFIKKNTHAVFYRAERNVVFDPKNWTGTVSYWLSLDPEKDLEPGYCDPILRRLENQRFGLRREEGPSIADVIREKRCRRLAQERGVPYEQVFASPQTHRYTSVDEVRTVLI